MVLLVLLQSAACSSACNRGHVDTAMRAARTCLDRPLTVCTLWVTPNTLHNFPSSCHQHRWRSDAPVADKLSSTC